ncbi:MAG TPA: hypothetical protein EYP85_00675 [Armatimonadetes bacterium]|nr:hypothetical protein [Armatimonadota bacterium]
MSEDLLSQYVEELIKGRAPSTAEYARKHNLTDAETVRLMKTAALVHAAVQSVQSDPAAEEQSRGTIQAQWEHLRRRGKQPWWRQLWNRWFGNGQKRERNP